MVEILDDPYFVETGAKFLWAELFGARTYSLFPAGFSATPIVDHRTGKYDPRRALRVYAQRFANIQVRDIATKVPRRGSWTTRAQDMLGLATTFLITFFRETETDCLVTTYAAVTILHRYAKIIGARELQACGRDIYPIAIGCIRLAKKYRESMPIDPEMLTELTDYCDYYNDRSAAHLDFLYGAPDPPLTSDDILKAEAKVAYTLDYDFTQPSLYDYMRQLAAAAGIPEPVDNIKSEGGFVVAALVGLIMLATANPPDMDIPTTAARLLKFASGSTVWPYADLTEFVPRTKFRMINKAQSDHEIARAMRDFSVQADGVPRHAVTWKNFMEQFEETFGYDLIKLLDKRMNDVLTASK